MKILYGIQGTGNGHISRARMMAAHFTRLDIAVDYLFSGREQSAYFDMQPFGAYQTRAGLTFSSSNGRVSYIKTALANKPIRFIRDVISLDLAPYDLILTDFEPVVAWAARLRNKPLLGVGHQYAFGENTPLAGANPIAKTVMRLFAPAPSAIGLHWQRYNTNILPPIVNPALVHSGGQNKHSIVVYLPFENQQSVLEFVSGFDDFHFTIYSPDLEDSERGKLSLRKTCHEGFKRDLQNAAGVICNSGFELISECLHLGIAVLTKPQQWQMEQQSNAAALEQLRYATVLQALDKGALREWLSSLQPSCARPYPDVAAAIVNWIANGRNDPLGRLGDQLWREVEGAAG